MKNIVELASEIQDLENLLYTKKMELVDKLKLGEKNLDSINLAPQAIKTLQPTQDLQDSGVVSAVPPSISANKEIQSQKDIENFNLESDNSSGSKLMAKIIKEKGLIGTQVTAQKLRRIFQPVFNSKNEKLYKKSISRFLAANQAKHGLDFVRIRKGYYIINLARESDMIQPKKLGRDSITIRQSFEGLAPDIPMTHKEHIQFSRDHGIKYSGDTSIKNYVTLSGDFYKIENGVYAKKDPSGSSHSPTKEPNSLFDT